MALCLSGIRSTSLLYQVVCLQAVLLLSLLAGYSTTRAFSVGKLVDLRWLAIVSASAVADLFFLVTGITGEVWLFGIYRK
jgi:hypothetical protein